MSLRIVITAPAQVEIAEAVKYYEEQRPSAGVKFWIEFKGLAKRLKNFPELYSRFGKRGIRKAPMHSYPHGVYYRIAGDELRAYGVSCMVREIPKPSKPVLAGPVRAVKLVNSRSPYA